ncbi:MAG: alanine racemase [Eubacterium sp.]|nr:alanine racemase [Eubacterium sp.]
MNAVLSKYKTPFYVFDIKALRDRIDHIRSSMPAGVAICYAIKANTFIVNEICDHADKFEVCSPGELSICLQQGIPAEKLVISGVYKTPEVFEELFEANIPIGCYTAESTVQFDLLRGLAHKHKRRIKLLLRLSSGNQFGMDEAEVERIIAEHSGDEYVSIIGIQYFSGTQKTSLKKFQREIDHLDEFMAELEEKFGFKSEELEFGTGFPVSYFEGEKTDEEALFKGFFEILLSMKYKAKLSLEIGRSIAACCGSYFTSVVDAKTNKDQNYAIMDGGMHQLVYFGQFMAMKKPFLEVLPSRDTGEEKEWNLCGSLCTANDILVKQLPVRDLHIGDTVVFKNTGAYCPTEGISLFLSRDLPRVILLGEDGSITSVREPIDTYEFNLSKYERN